MLIVVCFVWFACLFGVLGFVIGGFVGLVLLCCVYGGWRLFVAGVHARFDFFVGFVR